MSKAYLRCVRVWTAEAEIDGTNVELEDGTLVEVRPGTRIAADVEMTSLFASLTPEQQQAVLDYDGPEDHGDPEWRNKR